MTKTTYVATAPDGSQHTRKTERTYTHAVLLEGEEGWGAVGFCGRPDLAEKKRGERPGSIVVECGVLDNRAAHMPEAEAPDNAEPTVSVAGDAPECEQTVPIVAAAAEPHCPGPRTTIGSLVQELLIDPDLGYLSVVDRVRTEFPDAKTSVRSVASVATGLRKRGVKVRMRRGSKA